MSEKSKPVTKSYKARKDFVFEGQNIHEGEIIEVLDPKKVSGLIRRGFIGVGYSEPKPPKDPNNPKPQCPASDCIQQRLANSDDFEVQPKPTRRRRTRNVDISLKDQHLVDQANKIA